jgi:H+/Cl- antiporter ClcA
MYAVQLGIVEQPVGQEFLRRSCSSAMSWARTGLIAGLAGSFAAQAGFARAGDFSKVAMRTIVSGGIVWLLYFINAVDWRAGKELVPRRFDHDLLMLWLSFLVLQAICLVQTAFLAVMATRAASHTLREMKSEDQRYDAGWTSSTASPEGF